MGLSLFSTQHTFRLGVLAAGLLALAAIISALLFMHYWSDAHTLFMSIIMIALCVGSLACFGITFIGLKRQYRDRSILSEMFQSSYSARLVTDIQNKTLFFNPAFEDLCAECDEPSLDILRKIFEKSADQDSQERLEALITNAMRGHEDQMEVPLRDERGQRWLRISAQPVAGWVGTLHWRIDDITEKRSVEAVIREEREKLIDFTDHAPVGFYAMDETGRFTFVNATLARWLGSDIDSLLNQGRLQAYMVKTAEIQEPYDILPAGGAKQVAEIKMKGPAGRIFTASINQSVVHESDDRVRVRGVVHDLTAEREMSRALRDSEDRFRRFFEEAPLGIALIDMEGQITHANKTLANMIHSQEADIEGQNFADIIDSDDRQAVIETLNKIEEGQRTLAPLDITLKGQNEDDEHVAVQMHARKFRGRNIVIHFIDRSEQKSLEAQFAQSQKMQAVGQLAGGVAHDFNNLLTAMIGFCDLLLLRHKAGDPSFGDIMQIKQNANRAANLVRQLLAFSRQQQLQPKVLDITETLTELSHLIRRLIGVQIDLEVIHDSDLGVIKADEGQFEQVMINLAVNARDAMEGKGALEIRTQNIVTSKPSQKGADMMPAGEWVAIHVKDTGCGMDDETLERIFEPFFTTKDIGKGTGLGLSTVYGIIRQTGGFVHVDSQIDHGTTFSLFFPRHSGEDNDTTQTVTDTAQKEGQDLTGTATILLVEDEDAVRMFSARALANKGYRVLEADSGEAALEVLAQENATIDLLITDVIMPEMDGPTLAKKILEQQPELPVIFVSGYTEDRFEGQLTADAHFMPKPFTLQQLAEKAKDVLAAH